MMQLNSTKTNYKTSTKRIQLHNAHANNTKKKSNYNTTTTTTNNNNNNNNNDTCLSLHLRPPNEL
jgi:hypothetical protein